MNTYTVATGDVKSVLLCYSLLPSYCLIIQLQNGRLLNFILWSFPS